ncbi:putative zinc-type alcohol dehydrogenase-like protein C16A3.02c [Cadophora sp. MPI-SDFR-AT-0126]|nr:putative zinc-type alcohol dehydrogenase-like protein C16A3.02c [Leotiomycetes sp. MPI-SDFR-AT-0126]
MAAAKNFPPATMRAWQYTSNRNGLDKSMKINPSAPVPKPKPNQHLVQILATALNPVDYKPAEMPLIGRLLVSYPATPGLDFAGRIVTPATGSSLEPGQLVFGVAGTSPLAGGAMADFAIVEGKHAVAIPEGVSTLDVAVLGVAGLTAYQSIVPRVKKGDHLFINGGSGGTGTLGIQFAKAVGCHVTTTCSTANVELCKRLGADVVIDYKEGNVLAALLASGRKFDHAVDNVGHIENKELWWRWNEYAKPNASYVLVAGEMSIPSVIDMATRALLPKFLGGLKGKIDGFWPAPKPEDLEQVAVWIKERKVKPVIDQKFAFEDGAKAMEKLKTGRAKGKIVIDVALETYKKSVE